MYSNRSRELRCLLFLPALLKASCVSGIDHLASMYLHGYRSQYPPHWNQ